MFSLSQYKYCANCRHRSDLNLGFCKKCFSCKKCGNQISETNKFCEICGSELFYKKLKMLKEDDDLFKYLNLIYKNCVNFILRIVKILKG